MRLAGERETLGLYLTGHPLARFESGLARFVSHRIGDLVSDRPVAGLESVRFGAGKRGDGGRTHRRGEEARPARDRDAR